MKSLKEMSAEVEDFERSKGWLDQQFSFGERMALLHSEVSEALEAWRMWGTEDATEGAYFPDGTLYGGTRPKPEGVGSEYADILIRLIGDARRDGIDLDFEYERKMAFNRTRPYRHGGKRI
jgi:NTP pyrophosphatase (non-canonical NTP hydrolase)